MDAECDAKRCVDVVPACRTVPETDSSPSSRRSPRLLSPRPAFPSPSPPFSRSRHSTYGPTPPTHTKRPSDLSPCRESSDASTTPPYYPCQAITVNRPIPSSCFVDSEHRDLEPGTRFRGIFCRRQRVLSTRSSLQAVPFRPTFLSKNSSRPPRPEKPTGVDFRPPLGAPSTDVAQPLHS